MFRKQCLFLLCVNLRNSACDFVIYVLCWLSCFVSFAKITLPLDPTDWGSTAQSTGEYLKCGPSDFSASYATRASGELLGGSKDALRGGHFRSDEEAKTVHD